jgi:hypothetical protein
MKRLNILLYTFFAVVFFIFVIYLVLPISNFPPPPPGAIQSFEQADTETPLRRAYFTNLTRAEVLSHYEKYFPGSLKLNYPPEESQTIIRDQTRSTFLEERAYPLRESLYINGFEPKLAKDAIVIDGQNFRQKIIIRHVPSNDGARVLLGICGVLLIFVIIKEYLFEIKLWRN